MPLWEFYGNNWAVELFNKIILEDKVKHAYLFTGPEGVGRSTFAKRFSQALLCEKSKLDGAPCGLCTSCKKIENDQHFDVKVLRREPGSKDFKVSQVLEVEKFLSITPYSSPYKIVVLKDFDQANTEAQNAILKTLEEAPSYAILILIAESVQGLLPTVVSRCEGMDFRSVELDTLRMMLSDKFPGHNSIELAARLADGRPGLAIRYCHPDGALFADREAAVQSFFSILNSRLAERFDFSSTLWDSERKSLTQAKKDNKKSGTVADSEFVSASEDHDLITRTLRYWYLILRDCAIMKNGANVEIINFDHEIRIKQLADLLSQESILAGLENTQVAFRQLQGNVNKRLLMDVFLMDLFNGKIIKIT